MELKKAFRPLAGIAVAALLFAACGNGDDEAADETAATETPSAETIEVEMADYEFVGLPATVEAGTQFTVTNSSEAELHEIVALRIPGDEERSVAELMQLPPEEAQAAFAGPAVFVLLAPPGGPQIDAVGDGTLSEPGRYAFACFIPTGIDPDEYLQAAQESGEGPPEVEGGGPPHIVHGMFAEVVVE